MTEFRQWTGCGPTITPAVAHCRFPSFGRAGVPAMAQKWAINSDCVGSRMPTCLLTTLSNGSNRILISRKLTEEIPQCNYTFGILTNVKVEKSDPIFRITCLKYIQKAISDTKHLDSAFKTCPRDGHLKFRDLRPLASFSKSRSRIPFCHVL